MVVDVRARTICVDANWGADETNRRKTNNIYRHSYTWMWTQVACEPFVIVCASRCRRVEVCCIAHCDWFMTNIWNAMYFPVSFCFAFGIARRRKDATNGLIPSLGRVERVQYGETEDWLWRTLIASGMNELFTTDTFIPTRLRRMEKIVFTFPSFAYILQNILLLSNSSVEHENQKPRAKGKKKCLWNCQMNNSSAYLPTK